MRSRSLVCCMRLESIAALIPTILCLALSVHVCECADVEDVSSAVGLGVGAGWLMAFADVNNDQKTDVVVAKDSGTAINAHAWDVDKKRFTPVFKANIDVTNAAGSDARILSMHPGDFNFDGMTDLLVSTQRASETHAGIVRSYLFKRDVATFEQPFLPPVATIGEPLVLDADGDTRLDVFGLDADTGLPTFFLGDVTGNFSKAVPTPSVAANMSLSHAMAFTDFDGDCVADIAVVASDGKGGLQIEIHLNRHEFTNPADLERRFGTVDVTIPIPTGSGQPTYADVDGDGAFDVVVPVRGSSSSVFIALNSQMRTCGTYGAKSGECRESTSLCVADRALHFTTHYDGAALSGGVFPIGDSLPWLRACDYNLDGYTDFVSVLEWETGFEVTRLENFFDASTGLRRLRAIPTAALNSLVVGSPVDVAPFDLYDDGIPDLIVATSLPASTSSAGDGRAVVALSNKLYSDAYFMKVAVGSGACPAKCDGPVQYPHPKPYGNIGVGSTVKYTITDVSGNLRMSSATQLSQSSHRALQTPYVVFGLGRSPNYVKDLCVGVPFTENGKPNFNQWTLVIPNSLLFVFPYEPFEPTLWTLDLLITPAKVLVWTGVVLLAMCLMLSIVVLALHWKEKREDEREKRRMAHLFHFDAM